MGLRLRTRRSAGNANDVETPTATARYPCRAAASPRGRIDHQGSRQASTCTSRVLLGSLAGFRHRLQNRWAPFRPPTDYGPNETRPILVEKVLPRSGEQSFGS